MNRAFRIQPGQARAFTLVEVILSLGIITFALSVLIGLFSVGLKENRDSEGQIEAADLATLLVNTCIPTGTNGFSVTNAIPIEKLGQGYANLYTRKYINFSGQLTDATHAAYAITCSAGTNALTGPNLSQIYLRLTWPPQASGTTTAGAYELVSYISLPSSP